MTHFIDIRLRPDPDFSASLLLDALFSKLHRALARHAQGDIGISFPGCANEHGLGQQLRLHGAAAALNGLMEQAWLTGMLDHVWVSPATPVPDVTAYRVVRRVQVKSSPERIRRRQMRRHGLSEQQALDKVPDSARKTLRLPYLHLRSSSTGQSFPLFVEHGPLLTAPQPGCFSTYGLSEHATIPWF